MKRSVPHPFHHRQIIPWYAAPAVCWTLLVVMLMVFAFALVGVSVAHSEATYGAYLWVPITLGGLSATVIGLLLWRLFKRRLQRRRDD